MFCVHEERELSRFAASSLALSICWSMIKRRRRRGASRGRTEGRNDAWIDWRHISFPKYTRRVSGHPTTIRINSSRVATATTTLNTPRAAFVLQGRKGLVWIVEREKSSRYDVLQASNYRERRGDNNVWPLWSSIPTWQFTWIGT